jgi:two-component system, cell cycle sensor histidine kinase and response regulator CckA
LLNLSLLLGLNPTFAEDVQRVSLQLRWDHQFQFAGYYAAQWQGYYEEEGLAVDIRSAVPDQGTILSAVREVAEGRADFGIGATDILLAVGRGEHLVVTSSIFQKSAAAYFLLADTPFEAVADFARMRVARNPNDLIDIEFQAMLRAEGVHTEDITYYPHETGLDRLKDRTIDAMPGYVISAPYNLLRTGYPFKSIQPSQFGVAFYGDSIFTREEFLDRNREVVDGFTRASLKGWTYALDNPVEVAERITSEMPRTAPAADFGEFNRFQIDGTTDLTQHSTVELGHINVDRWQRMYDHLHDLGIVEEPRKAVDFVYRKVEYELGKERRTIRIAVAISTSLVGLLMISLLVSVWLRRVVSRKTQQLRSSEERFRQMIVKSPLPVVVTDQNSDIILFNEKFTELFGYTLEDVYTAEQWWSAAYPDEEYRALVQASWTEAIAEAQRLRASIPMQEWDLTVKNGSRRTCEFSMMPFDDFSLIIMNDITERKKYEQSIFDTKERLESVINSIPDATVITNEHREIEICNPAFSTIFGYSPEEAIGKTTSFLYVDELVYRSAGSQRFNASARLTPDRYASQYRRKNGEVFPAETVGTPYKDQQGRTRGYVGIMRDVTAERRKERERIALEAELSQAQKMESIGRLAGGVAHDFNNMLTTIIGYSELISADEDLSDATVDGLREILGAANSGAALTQQLLAFSRRQVLQPQVMYLNDIVLKLTNMLGRLIGEDIRLITDLDEGLRPVKVDPVQMEQLITNLVINAKDAIPNGGTVAIETQGCTVGEDGAERHSGVMIGDYLMLTVRDDGVGMDEETLSRVFEPFYTTKKQGKGTGLGLATVHGVVSQSGGFIEVESKPDKGTSFRIYLPQLQGGADLRETELSKRPPPGGGERVLLVEDNSALRKMAGKALAELGYSVIEASSGDDALRIVRDKETTCVDLMVTDVVMPDMNGKKLSEKLVGTYPDMKVLFVSGYTDDSIVHHGVLDEGIAFLQKPFSLHDLAEKVRGVLDGQ